MHKIAESFRKAREANEIVNYKGLQRIDNVVNRNPFISSTDDINL